MIEVTKWLTVVKGNFIRMAAETGERATPCCTQKTDMRWGFTVRREARLLTSRVSLRGYESRRGQV